MPSGFSRSGGRGGGWGFKNVGKNPPPLFWVKNHEHFGAENFFSGPDSIGFVWSGVAPFLQYVALPRTGQAPCKRRNHHFHQEWLTCVHGLVHNLLMQFFTFGNSKSKFPKLIIFKKVATHNDHPSYVSMF